MTYKIVRWEPDIQPAQIDEFICKIQRTEFNLQSPEKFNFCLYKMDNYYKGNNNRINFFIALDGTDIVGSIGLRNLDSSQCELRKFYVASNYRSKGLGKRLFELALQAARENNYIKMYTGTMKIKVNAQAFYENHHFKEIDRKFLPAIFQSQVLDEMFYVRTLEGSIL